MSLLIALDIGHFRVNSNVSFLLFSLQGTRAKVWKQRMDSPLFNVRTYASDLEKLLRLVYEKYMRGEKVDHVTDLAKRQHVC